MARIAHLLDHPGHGDSRVFRAAHAQHDMGHEVVIFALNRTGEAGPTLEAHDVKIVQCAFNDAQVIPILSKLSAMRRKRMNLKKVELPKQSANRLPITGHPKAAPGWKRALGMQFWHRAALKAVQQSATDFMPDLIHAHDLTMLPSGVKLAKRLGAKLIYDSHEYERSRNLISPGQTERIRIGFEDRYIKLANAIICVSDSIADQMAKDHRMVRPLVIPNAAETGVTQTIEREQFGLPKSVKLAIYIGSFQPGRGLKRTIRAISATKDWHLLIMGSSTDARRAELKNAIEASGISDRVSIRKAVPKEAVCNIIAMCDVSVIPMQKTCLSYEYSLPNKLFQSVVAEVPLIVTPLSEMSAFVRHFGVGHVADGFEAVDLAKALEKDRPILQTGEVDLTQYSSQYTAQNYQTITEAVLFSKPLPVIPPLPHFDQISRHVPQTPL